jgi:ElaB/YqjD/DUF883 family membrane-anchored ribosome-binding protein
MATRTKSAAADEISAIEDLISDLEKRLHRLSGSAKREASGASGDVGDFVSEALASIMKRVSNGSNDSVDSLTDDVARYGIGAFKKLTKEVEQRPLVLLGIAASVGFLAALLSNNKR